MIKVAQVVKWLLLAVIVGVIALELAGYLLNWVMGAFLVPLVFAFFYFWQLATKASKHEE